MDISERTWRKLLRDIRQSNKNLTRQQIEDLDRIINENMTSTSASTGILLEQEQEHSLFKDYLNGVQWDYL